MEGKSGCDVRKDSVWDVKVESVWDEKVESVWDEKVESVWDVRGRTRISSMGSTSILAERTWEVEGRGAQGDAMVVKNGWLV